jgi:hypothetical protein
LKGGETVATKLRNLKVTKVDFVDQGANPDAHILLFKRKEPMEKGELETATKGAGEKGMNLFEKIGKAIADAIGIKSPEDIGKAASTFEDEKRKARVRRLFDQNWWDYISALRESLEKILTDENLSDSEKEQMIAESLEEFSKTVQGTLTNPAMQTALESAIEKVGRKISSERLERMKNMRDILDNLIQEAETNMNTDDDMDNDDEGDLTKGCVKQPKTKTEKGEDVEMKIDKSKMTPAERAFYEEIEKRYGVTEGGNNGGQTSTGTDPVGKSNIQGNDGAAPAAGSGTNSPTDGGTGTGGDVYKGLHPDVAAELQELRKFRENAELEKMQGIAKKYEILGKKPDELAKKLIDLKKAGGTAYDDYISVLDEQVQLLEKSGMFSEIGKRGNGENDAWATIEKKADELLKNNPNMTRAQAIDKACELNPELVEAYEKSRK